MTTRPILVAHGALGSAQQMQPIVDALRALDDGLVVSTIEFPGHGHTALAHDDDFRIARYVDVMAAAIADFDEPPLLFGYSMGGYVGLALESRAPGTFAGIVTLGTKFEWTPEAAEREAMRLNPAVIAVKVPRFAEALAARHHGLGGWETVMVRTAALLRANAQAPLLTVEALERIAIPVVVAVGSKDDTVSVAESEATAALMLNATCVALDDVPHPIERVPPDRVVALVRELLARI